MMITVPSMINVKVGLHNLRNNMVNKKRDKKIKNNMVNNKRDNHVWGDGDFVDYFIVKEGQI